MPRLPDGPPPPCAACLRRARPNADITRATAVPIHPRPTIRTVLPASSRGGSSVNSFCAHTCSACRRCATGSRRRAPGRPRRRAPRSSRRASPGVGDDHVRGPHGRKQHPAHAGRRAVDPAEPRAAASISGRMIELNAISASGMSAIASGRVRALTTSMSPAAARIRSTTQSGVSHATHRL